MRVFWFLCGNENTPSSRIHGIKVHEELVKLGYHSVLVHKPPHFNQDVYYPNWLNNILARFLTKGDIAIFQKLHGVRAIRLVRYLKRRGVRVVFVDCDLPIKPEMATLAEIVVCPSKEMCEQYLRAGISVVYHIDDAVEVMIPPQKNSAQKGKIIWFGKSRAGKWDSVDWFVNTILPEISDQWEFQTVSDHVQSTFHWNVETAPVIINQADLVIIPVTSRDFDVVKSANRCTQSFALGVPVLANFLPSYRQVIIDDYNGYISNKKEEWISFIRRLEDSHFLWQLKQNAFSSGQRFAMNQIISQWIDTLCLKKPDTLFFSSMMVSLITKFYTGYYAVKQSVSRMKKRLLK